MSSPRYEFKEISFTVDGAVAIINLIGAATNKMNTLSKTVCTELIRCFDVIEETESIRALVLTATGRAFCVGANLSANMMEKVKESSFGTVIAESLAADYHPAFRRFTSLSVPTVAAVQGMAVGGGLGFALGADLTVAATTASFQFVFIPKLGIAPDLGTTYFLCRSGLSRQEAFALACLPGVHGATSPLIQRCIFKTVADEQLMTEAVALGHRLAQGPVYAMVRYRADLESVYNDSLTETMRLEIERQRELGDRPEAMAGMTAFFLKKPANFKKFSKL